MTRSSTSAMDLRKHTVPTAHITQFWSHIARSTYPHFESGSSALASDVDAGGCIQLWSIRGLWASGTPWQGSRGTRRTACPRSVHWS
jgi:hypothetical protein